ncbi:MAG TPA: hypothetical protein PKW99_14610 [Thauera sp.]|jgi:UDP-N-acetyl-D-galactosamine dehydrogenase|nr:hypothetical protein [Thauera sp.]
MLTLPNVKLPIIAVVAHDQFKALGHDGIHALGKPEQVLYDLKYVLPRDAADLRL